MLFRSLSIRIDIWFYQGNVRASHACKLPIAPMGFSQVSRLCLQGGGVFIGGGTVSFSSCAITGNTAAYVRAHAQKFPSPRWEFLLTCPIDSHLSIRIDIWFYQSNVRACHACKLPIAPMGRLLTRALASTLACTFAADDPINYRMYVQPRYEIFPSPCFPSPRWEMPC